MVKSNFLIDVPFGGVTRMDCGGRSFAAVKLGCFRSPEASMKKLSNHPVMSQEWMKDQMQQIPESERIFKSRKIPIPQEAFTSSLPDKK